MYSNKHVVIALLVAPVLALISYFAVDRMVSEAPHAAQVGASYPLVEQSNCRYSSGACDLSNGDVAVHLTVESLEAGTMLLSLSSSVALEGAKVALVQTGAPATTATSRDAPVVMRSMTEAGLAWTVRLPSDNAESARLRLVLSAAGTLYFGEAQLTFVRYETAFKSDFRHEKGSERL